METIKKWYLTEYASDAEIVQDMGDEITFMDVWKEVVKGMNGDVYGVMNSHDSVVRERVFSRLADKMRMKYDTIYELWLSQPGKDLI